MRTLIDKLDDDETESDSEAANQQSEFPLPFAKRPKVRLALEYDATQCNIEWEDWVEKGQQEQEEPEPVEQEEPEPVEQEQEEKDWLMGHFHFARTPVTPERVEQEQEEKEAAHFNFALTPVKPGAGV